jgi:PIN domain nuclease of toxin-antitoxin system
MTDRRGTVVDCVLDASAVLAFLQGEPGAALVETRLPRAVICAVNLSEVAGKLIDAGMPEAEAREVLEALGIEVIPFDAPVAWQEAALRPLTRRFGLSLGDRACLATGFVLERPVVGGDNVWAELELPVAVELIR